MRPAVLLPGEHAAAMCGSPPMPLKARLALHAALCDVLMTQRLVHNGSVFS
jgi:hypothetical protein